MTEIREPIRERGDGDRSGNPLAAGEWRWRALCARVGSPNDWYSERFEVRREAREVCGRCPVFEQCGKAGERESYGIWAGVDRERRASKAWQP